MATDPVRVPPLGLVFGLLMRHVTGEFSQPDGHGRTHIDADMRCCRPFRDEDGPEAMADPLPGREAQGRFAVLPISELPILGAGQTDADDAPKRAHRTKFRRKGELKARR